MIKIFKFGEVPAEEVFARFSPTASVEGVVAEIIAEVGASQPSDMGKVMGVATKRLAGLADGRMISTLVKKLLAK